MDGEVVDLETDMLPLDTYAGNQERYVRTGETEERDGITVHVYEKEQRA